MLVNRKTWQFSLLLRNSKRVEEAYDMMHLEKGEYILKFLPNGKTVTTRSGATGRKLIDGPTGDMDFFYREVQNYVKKEIIDFFGLRDIPIFKNRNPAIVTLNCIFYGYEFYPEPYYIKPFTTKRGVAKITITFQGLPNDRGMKLLCDGVREAVDELKEMVDRDPRANLRTPMLPFDRVSHIDDFDNKFVFANRYREIQNDKSITTTARAGLTKTLYEEAQTVLPSSCVASIDVFRNEMTKFLNIYNRLTD